MPLAPGTVLGPYQIVAPLGAGGMGEVYRAKDTRLGRDVAIKVMPQHLSDNPEVRARFEREAKTVSGLNHPHICTLFDVGREGDTDFLVMELVEGDTLAARLKRGPLPGPELLRLATQVADALDRAHRAGVIHRDLKPGNVMVTKSGAKLMDFGLSRVTGMAGTDGGSGGTTSALTQSPTVAQALTAEGTLLGTFQYMSPEQLEGREADARSDLWALGCVLYEMATGRRAFEGRSQASLIAAILEREPAAIGEPPSGSVSRGAPAPPHGLERLIRNCLAKDPDDRIQTAHDVKLQLQAIADGTGAPSTHAGSAARTGGARLAWTLAAAGFATAAVVFGWLWPRVHAPQPPIRFRLDPIANASKTYWPRISPDGRQLLVTALDSSGTGSSIYLRPLDEADARLIPGTAGIRRAYWSPDGREIVFALKGSIQRMPVSGGVPTVVCAASNTSDLSWGSKGLILTDGLSTDSLRVVPASGGELKPATRIDHAAGEIGSAWPCFLPDCKHFLFIGNLPGSTGGDIRLGRIGSLDSRRLGRSDGRVEYAPGGWVLFLRESRLLAQRLDVRAGRLTGQPIIVVESVRTGSSRGHFSVSQTGVLAYARENAAEALTLEAWDRAGTAHGAPLATGLLTSPKVSPDGHRLLYVRAEGGTGATGDVHVLDLDRGTDVRLTFTGDHAVSPQWSSDGTRIAWMTIYGVRGALHVGAADGLGTPDSFPLPGALIGGDLSQWSPVGPQLVYVSRRGGAFTVPVAPGPRPLAALVDTTQQMWTAQVSPDGRWLAGSSGNGEDVRLFVVSVTGPAGRWEISNRAGIFPRWTRGGRELVWETFDARLMAADIDTSGGFRAGVPHELFVLPSPSSSDAVTNWGCDASGEHFYVLASPRHPGPGLIEVVTGFGTLMNRK